MRIGPLNYWIFNLIYKHRYGGISFANRVNTLKKLEWSSLEEIQTYQKKRLNQLLKSSFEGCTYYQKLQKKLNLKLTEKNPVEILKSLPILTKKELRAQFKELQNINYSKKTYTDTSGGSTGEPVPFIQNYDYKVEMLAVKTWLPTMFDVNFGDKKIKLWGSERDIFNEKESLSNNISNAIKGVTILNSFRMSKDTIKDYIKQINSSRPKIILAYVQSAYELSKYILEHDIKMHKPHTVMTSAGVLYPNFKKTIEQAFGCTVSNRYGSREVGDIACSCSADEGLHISSGTHFVEILDKNLRPTKDGQIGEIYVTLLTNFSMPLIRYKIGDKARVKNKPCCCGRKLPMIDQIVGRTVDLFINSRDEFIDGEYFTHLFYHKDYISKFQVVQKSKTKIDIKVILKDKNQSVTLKSDIPEIKRKMQIVMGKNCIITFKEVKSIESSTSGKYRYTIRDF